jgi:3'-phosphoadenosine 5'-phosphosulfate sulfotransferase (PAPS reductase)/FAD synthetase
LKTPEEILDGAIGVYQPSHIFACLSGGHDSLTVTHFAENHLKEKLDAVVHINTGIGIEETREFVRNTCKDFGWKLLEYKATENTKADGTPDPQIYEDLVVERGFPGPHHHTKMFNRLKERQLNRLVREHKQGKRKIMLISGMRQQESVRRMGHKDPVQEQGRIVWVAPFFYLNSNQVNDYMVGFDLPRNPVKDLFCMSGECLCGAFAHKGELAELELHYPETAKKIREIEKKVRAAGFPWGWEEAPPAWWGKRKHAEKVGQADAFQQEAEDEIRMLCSSCEAAYEEQERRK